MAGSLNNVQLIGNLGADPEIRSFQNGGRVANFRIATSEQWKDKQTGEKRERTQWHSVACFVDGLVGVIQQHLHKGSKVYVQGQLETRKWQDQSGNDRYTTEVVLRPFNSQLIMLDGRQNQGQNQGYNQGGYNQGGYDQNGYQQNAGQGQPQQPPDGMRNDGSAGFELDDDIPF